MRPRWLSLLALCTTLTVLGLLAGCQGKTQTFAGFTFGGGGKTYSCEPATWTSGPGDFELTAGVAGGETSIRLAGKGSMSLGAELPLSEARVAVPGQETSAILVSGHLVCQSQQGEVAHGSFDAKVKAPDGREFPVVGSFTARIQNQP